MHNSKLLTLLKSIPTEEMHWLQKFLNSPFYNSNKNVIRLFQYIEKYYPDLNSPKLTKEKTFKKLFPNEPFKVQKMRKLMYELANLTEAFLVAMRLRKNEFDKKKLLVAELGDRNEHELFKKGTTSLIEKLEALPYRNIDFYKDMHFLNLHFFEHIGTKKEKKDLIYLKTSLAHLDYYFLLQRQRLEFAIKWSQRLYGKGFDITTIKQSQRQLFQTPIFKIYKLIIDALSTIDNEPIYEKIEMLFKNEVERLDRKDQKEILRLLLNFIASQINKGDSKYRPRILSLYKFGLKNNLFIENGILRDNSFLNIATVAIQEKDYEWVEYFINSHQDYLALKRKKDAVILIKGKLLFEQKKFDATIELLFSYNTEAILYAISSKIILLKSYFEKYLIDESFYEFLIDKTHSFEKYIRRNAAISAEKKEFYLNFVFYLRKLSNNISRSTFDKPLYKKVITSKSLVEKSWLIIKINGLSSGKKRG